MAWRLDNQTFWEIYFLPSYAAAHRFPLEFTARVRTY